MTLLAPTSWSIAMERTAPLQRTLAILVNGALLLLGGAAWADEPASGFYADGVGLEISGSVGLHTSRGALDAITNEPGPEWQLALRLRIGKFLSIGVSGETVSGVSVGNELTWKRQEVGVNLEWRFWGYRGVVRPWAGVGMAWGNVEVVGTDEYYRHGIHLWEFLRLSAGCDVLVHPNLAIGPWFRIGWGQRPTQPYSGEGSVRTMVFAFRVTAAIP